VQFQRFGTLASLGETGGADAMPIISNPRHEKFAQVLAEGKPAINAYEMAGYKPDRGAASRLSANVSIQARVAELQGKAAESAIVTLEGLIQEAAELQVAGLKLNQISAAVAALTAKAKLAGFWVDKAESTNTNYVVSAEPEPTREEWETEFCRPAVE
jgi:phage terminase small subunit